MKCKFLSLRTKNFLHFLKNSLSYISGNKTFFKKFLIFQLVTFQARKIKKTFQKNFVYFFLKVLFMFQEELPKPQKPKFLIPLQKKLYINVSKNTLG